MADHKTELDNHTGGLILMIIFTAVWTILSEIFFGNSDYRIVGIIFGLIILYLINAYIKFSNSKKLLPEIPVENEPNNDKWFYTVVALEGVAIFVVQNILINIGKSNLAICSIALIVGLHFIPLAKVFNRKFDYYIGIWTIAIAIIGIILITGNLYDYRMINAFVCLCCAISTTEYGLKKVRDGNLFLKKMESIINTAANK